MDRRNRAEQTDAALAALTYVGGEKAGPVADIVRDELIKLRAVADAAQRDIWFRSDDTLHDLTRTYRILDGSRE